MANQEIKGNENWKVLKGTNEEKKKQIMDIIDEGSNKSKKVTKDTIVKTELNQTMANEQNLKPPFNKDSPECSHEKAVENGKKGAKRSAEVKRERKSLKQGFEIILEILSDKTIKEATDKNLKDGTIEMLEKCGYIPYKYAKMLMAVSVKDEIKLKIMQEMTERIEGKPKQVSELTGKDGKELNLVTIIDNIPK